VTTAAAAGAQPLGAADAPATARRTRMRWPPPVPMLQWVTAQGSLLRKVSIDYLMSLE
jgi:hypothetical protein